MAPVPMNATTRIPLEDWVRNNPNNLKPNFKETEELMQITQFTRKQIRDYFVRRRMQLGITQARISRSLNDVNPNLAVHTPPVASMMHQNNANKPFINEDFSAESAFFQNGPVENVSSNCFIYQDVDGNSFICEQIPPEALVFVDVDGELVGCQQINGNCTVNQPIVENCVINQEPIEHQLEEQLAVVFNDSTTKFNHLNETEHLENPFLDIEQPLVSNAAEPENQALIFVDANSESVGYRQFNGNDTANLENCIVNQELAESVEHRLEEQLAVVFNDRTTKSSHLNETEPLENPFLDIDQPFVSDAAHSENQEDAEESFVITDETGSFLGTRADKERFEQELYELQNLIENDPFYRY